jgi:hypothetical protein
MALSALDDKERTPTDQDVARVLGRTSNLWDTLRHTLAMQFEPLSETWRFSGKKYGWSLQLKQKKRTVVWLTPCSGHFLVGTALGEKAVKAAHESGLPAKLLDVIDSAKKYVEGRAIRLEVRTKKDLAAVQQLATIKMAN